jgi:hypothetical protein
MELVVEAEMLVIMVLQVLIILETLVLELQEAVH